MARKKEYFLVVDVETAGTIEQPICYDIGYAIADRQGNIYEERSYLVEEIFSARPDLMVSAHYASKIPTYHKMLAEGKAKLAKFYDIRMEMLGLMKEYEIKDVFAYNMGFDKRALANTMKHLTKGKWRIFFPKGTQYNCIWHMACQLIFSQRTYAKKAFKNNWVSESGNLRTNAEVCYNYITKQSDFVEEHTGLADVRIEVEIMAKCFKTRKKMDRGIKHSCWRIPNQLHKELISELRAS